MWLYFWFLCFVLLIYVSVFMAVQHTFCYYDTIKCIEVIYCSVSSFFFLRIVFAIWVSIWVLRQFLLVLWRISIALIMVYDESKDHCGQCKHFNWACRYMDAHLLVSSSNICISVLQFALQVGFISLLKFTTSYSIFMAIMNRLTFIIYFSGKITVWKSYLFLHINFIFYYLITFFMSSNSHAILRLFYI